MSQHYTSAQLEQLQQRADELGADGMRRAQQEWAELIAAIEAEREAGTDPADARLDPLVERWNGLIEAFTGGDAGIRASLHRTYESEGAEQASRGAVKPETMEYYGRALAARGTQPGA